jgi:hypothetical protein
MFRKNVKKLVGRTEIEDALKRLDRLTQEEARMAAAQNLKVTHTVDDRVKGVAGTVAAIDNRVAGVDDRVAGVGDQVQQSANDIDELKRLLLPNFISIDQGALRPILSGNQLREGIHRWLSHRTPRRTITLLVILITRKQRPGFFKAAFSRSGSQQDRFFGSTENVCPVHFPTRIPLIATCIIAGSGKSIIWFVDSQLFPSEMADSSYQFHGNTRY